MKAPAALPFYLYDFGAIQPDSFLQGDSFKLLEGVQTETVDMVFIDPPYFIKKAEWDTFENQQEYNDFMARAFWEAERILKPNGTLAFWHNDLQQVARLLCWLENWTQFVFNSWAVWVKPNFRKKLWANPGAGNTLRSWFNITEFCIVLVKGEPGTAWNKSGLALAKLDMNNFGPLREYFRAAQKYTGKTKKQIIDACGQAADHCFRWGSSQWLLPTRETYLDIVAKFELDSWEGYRDFDSLLEEQARLVQQYDEQIQAADNARFVHNLDANHCNVWLSNEPTGGGIQSTRRRSLLTCWNAQSEPTPGRARLSVIFSRAAAAPAWQPLKPGGGISLSNKAPATTKRGWHGLKKQKAPFALDCKRQ